MFESLMTMNEIRGTTADLIEYKAYSPELATGNSFSLAYGFTNFDFAFSQVFIGTSLQFLQI